MAAESRGRPVDRREPINVPQRDLVVRRPHAEAHTAEIGIWAFCTLRRHKTRLVVRRDRAIAAEVTPDYRRKRPRPPACSGAVEEHLLKTPTRIQGAMRLLRKRKGSIITLYG